MVFTIRTKLTFWYVSLLTVSLLVFGGVFSYSLLKIFMYRIDSQISSVANMMVHTVIKPSGQLFLPQEFDIILERFFGIRTAGNYIQVLDPLGTVVAKSSNLETFSLPIPRATYMAALHEGSTSFEIVKSVGRYPIRLVTKPIILKERGLVGIVQVGSSLESVQEVFRSFLYIFIPGMFASIIVASAVGWFLARKALQPVTEITKLAQRIGAENLSERLNISVSHDEIGMLATTINGMIERLENSFKQIKQFTADASHELKTPLTILKGEMEIALRSKDDMEHMRAALTSSLEEIDRMSSIVMNLLDLAKMDVEKGALPMVPVSIDRVLAERFEHFRRRAANKGIELVLTRSVPAVVTGDSVRLSQLLANLIDNAVKYTARGGRVELSLDIEGAEAVIRVKDTGMGIPAADIPYLFDRFYRVNQARSGDEGGAGLGLSICREIALAHGGTITVASEPGFGTTFTATLPLA